MTTGWTTGVRSPTEAEDFSSSLCVQTGSGAHPASCPKGTGGPFPGGKARPERDADHSPPSSAKVKYEWELYLLSPPCASRRVAGQLYFFFRIMELRRFLILVDQRRSYRKYILTHTHTHTHVIPFLVQNYSVGSKSSNGEWTHRHDDALRLCFRVSRSKLKER
jgi:hypothetical protein